MVKVVTVMKIMKPNEQIPFGTNNELDSYFVLSGYAGNRNNTYRPKVSIKSSVSVNDLIEAEVSFDIEDYISPLFEATNRSNINALIEELCREHPEITVDPDMLGGVPHIKGVRLSVGNVLAKLYHYGSIEKVLEVFQPDISEHQIKEAIAFAQDFLENASESR